MEPLVPTSCRCKLLAQMKHNDGCKQYRAWRERRVRQLLPPNTLTLLELKYELPVTAPLGSPMSGSSSPAASDPLDADHKDSSVAGLAELSVRSSRLEEALEEARKDSVRSHVFDCWLLIRAVLCVLQNLKRKLIDEFEGGKKKKKWVGQGTELVVLLAVCALLFTHTAVWEKRMVDALIERVDKCVTLVSAGSHRGPTTFISVASG